MPQNKDLKRLVRERMGKTGERFTVARMHVLKPKGRRSTDAPAPLAPDAPAQPLAARGPAAVYQLKISLDDIRPTIWRRLHVPADLKLDQLSLVLLAAMGWTNSHLHRFIVGGTHFAEPDPDGEDFVEVIDERTVSVMQLVEGGARSFQFVYDFGDHWNHTVEIEGAEGAPAASVPGPSCTGGERACPPEDCGGTPGYEQMLEILADPEHQEHDEMRRWVGGRYDGEAFSVAATNAALRRLWRKEQASRPGPRRSPKKAPVATEVGFVEVRASLPPGKTIQRPALPEEVRFFFIDWALEQYANWCARNGTKISVTRAEVAFPGPFMRLGPAGGRSSTRGTPTRAGAWRSQRTHTRGPRPDCRPSPWSQRGRALRAWPT